MLVSITMLYIKNKNSSSDNEFSNKEEAQKALDDFAIAKGLLEVANITYSENETQKEQKESE